MTVPTLLNEPCRIDEPRAVQDYADVLNRVAAGGEQVIVCRDGADLVAVIPVEQLEQVREILARQEVERQAAEIDWDRAKNLRPPQEWFEGDEPKPF